MKAFALFVSITSAFILAFSAGQLVAENKGDAKNLTPIIAKAIPYIVYCLYGAITIYRGVPE